MDANAFTLSTGYMYRTRISYKERTRRATNPGSHRYDSGHTHIPFDESWDSL